MQRVGQTTDQRRLAQGVERPCYCGLLNVQHQREIDDRQTDNGFFVVPESKSTASCRIVRSLLSACTSPKSPHAAKTSEGRRVRALRAWRTLACS